MSNRQADKLRLEALGAERNGRTFLMLKPARIKPKLLARLDEGTLLRKLDPFHLRIVRGDTVLARARLGRIGDHEAIHIVSTDPEPFPHPTKRRHHLLEIRLRLLRESRIEMGEVIEYDDPLSQEMLVLVDGKPIALAEMVEYDNEPVVQITEMLGG